VIPYARAWEDEFLGGLNGAEYKHLMQIFAKLNHRLDTMGDMQKLLTDD